MALSTVSSLNESFTSGIPLLSEEVGMPEAVKDKSGSPSVPLGGDEGKPSLPVISTDAEQVDENTKPQAEGTQNGEGGTGTQGRDAATKTEEHPAGEGAEEGDDESESGTDDDAILEVHT